MQRVVFICSGNLCRSPMAAGLAERMLAEAGIPAMVVSAGTLNIQGNPAAPHAITAMRELGLSIEHHRSQGASLLLLRAADHIVVMSPHHEQDILARDPKLAPKIRRLWEYCQPPGRLDEIADPVGMELAAFHACRDDIKSCLASWIDRMKRIAS